MADQEYNLIKVFKFFDEDGSGSIDKRELVRGLQALGCNPTEAEIDALIEEADSRLNPNGRLEFTEFSDIIEKHRRTREQEVEALVEAFRIFDRNGDGVIDKEELREALTTLGFSKLTNEEVDELFDEVDVNDSGTIELHELVRVMMA